MDSSFVTFSPKRKLKKTVHSKITKLSLRHTKRGHDKKSNALHKNKSPRKRESLQQTPPHTSIINLPADDHHENFGKKCLDTQNNSSKETKISVEKISLLNGEDSTIPFDPSSRGSASQFTCSVSVSNKTGISEDIITSSKIKIEVRTPPIFSKCNSIVVISETSSDESSSVAVSKPKKTTIQNVNIVINESDSEPESLYESVNSVENLSTHKATRTVLHSNASSDKQSEIQKWLQNISPNCKNSHNETRGETVISPKSEVQNPTNSWRSPTSALSSSESEDNFEEFIKSVKKKNQLLQQKVDTPDSLRNFLTDGSVENSPAFYLSLTNKLKTEEKKKAVTERTKKIYEESKEINPTVLKFGESDAEASDEEIKELEPVQKANASIKVVDSSPDVETLSSDTASGDTDDDSDSPSIIPPSDNKTRRPYQNQPQKVPSCRKPKTVQEKNKTVDQFPVFSFLASLSYDVPQQQSHSDAVLYRTEFKKRKEDLCSKLFCLYNKEVFKNQLPSDMSITWNSRLMKTAGLCYNKYSANKRTSRIELSVKVCDSADRLRDTLIHELCHSASWIIDGVKCGHGHHWKIWANTAMKCFPDIPPIRRCHDYKITTKFTYKCMKCGYSIGRHSKSLDIERKRCGYCLGKFELFINKPTSRRNTKTPAQLQTPRTPSAFAVFVKENYGSVKKDRSDLKHGDVMKLLGQKFAAIKVSTCLNTV